VDDALVVGGGTGLGERRGDLEDPRDGKPDRGGDPVVRQ